jgi:preprotein translocase subunit SecF
MELFKNSNFDFLGKKWPFIVFSLILISASIASLVIKGGPRYGIDFRGGTLVYVKFADRPPIEKIRAALAEKLGGTPDVQEVTGTNEVIIGTDVQDDERAQEATRHAIIETLSSAFGQAQAGKLDINNAGAQAMADRLRVPLQNAGVAMPEQRLQELAQSIRDFRDKPPQSGVLRRLDELQGVAGVNPQVISVLRQEAFVAPYAIRQMEIIGPKMGAELRQQALYVVLAALAGMLIYIAFRFEWIYGVAAVVAVAHDAFVTVGLFSILDKEITLTVLAALLTLVGYSMNDTIVIFDRIRENLKGAKRLGFEELVNFSINQTLSRTILTSGLTFLTAFTLWLFGGPVLNGFALALVIGIIVGTYSSVFIAGPILIWGRNQIESRKRNQPRQAPVSAAVRGRTPAKSVK